MSSATVCGASELADLDAVIEDLTLDAYGDDEQLAGFLVAAEEAFEAPQGATVVGVPVDVVAIVDGPDERRGLEAVCLRAGGQYHMSLADVTFEGDSETARVIAAYRRWLGLEPWPHRSPQARAVTPRWCYPGHVAGPDEPLADWAIPIVAAGPRTSFEFEHVLPGADDHCGFDPILDAVEYAHAGDRAGARRRLRALLRADARCLDAHAHLGWLAFEHSGRRALAHYQAGVALAERGLPEGFDGVLPWARIDNRPFLRCLHGLAVSLWRLKRWEEAASAATSLLWLNPADNQGASAVLADVRAGVPWVSRERR